ncbi:MAG: ribonuclease III [Syntrophobacteraceae bacterium]
MNQARHLEQLQGSLCYRFSDSSLLLRALVHRSYVHDSGHADEKDNETLEFLGDSVLGLAISHLLFQRFPDYTEGDLSRIRSSIVNERELARLASDLGLGEHLLLGKGEELTGGRQKPSLLADTLEAILAAVYLDGGLTETFAIVERLFSPYFASDHIEHPLKNLDKDFKTQLQELAQARFKVTPTYSLIKEEGPDHEKIFFMEVYLGDAMLERGSGKSKKEAQQDAASRAIRKLEKESFQPAGL